jgi:hypothetical protein
VEVKKQILAEEVRQYEKKMERLGKMMPLITVEEDADSLSSNISHDFLARGVDNQDKTKSINVAGRWPSR